VSDVSFSVGDIVELSVGPVAHGGHFVARMRPSVGSPDGARDVVVFVRHALTGERVRVRITEVDKSFLRGDAIEVLEASPERVAAPCALAHPDGCGGCDFQHVAVGHQRELKASVVREQLQRLAGVERDVVVEAVPVPGRPDDGLGWRTRMQYVPLAHGHGLRKHRSHDVVPVQDCPIAAPDARVTMVGGHSQRLTGDGTVVEEVLGRRFRVASDGFWQVHPEAPRVLVEAVLAAVEPRPGERVLDLYAGVGLFSSFLAEAVGPAGEVVAVESDRRATELAAANLEDQGWASVVYGRVDRVLQRWTNAAADLVVLDPPRVGAKKQVVRSVASLRPRAIAYVACDPAAMARDIGYFADAGYELASLRAFDLFPMTHHVECVALLTKCGSDLRKRESVRSL
jgi:tRNA/tmRNA/rRNA uracil-C5-methylase (TrmA/RlmC/RlmD family)